MDLIKTTILLLALLMLMGCKVEPDPIAFGSDHCSYCSMTIVDRQYAAQLVTAKGKVAKFDAVECMIHHLADVDSEQIGMVLCTDYSNPGTLIDARSSVYLISPELPSPMGANLTAFANEEQALMAKGKATGSLYAWEEVRRKILR